MAHVLFRQRERNASLNEIIADRYFAAISVAAARDEELIEIVRIGLDEHRLVELRKFERIGDSFLITEVGEDDEHAVDLIGNGAEKIGAFAGIGVSLDPPELGVVFIELNGSDAKLPEQAGQVGASFGYQQVGEEIPVAINHGECRDLCFNRSYHGIRNNAAPQQVFLP